jgi:hypothetical protein
MGHPFFGLLEGPEVGDDLPALGLGEAGPGGHAVTEIALAEEPFDVAITRGAKMFAAQRRSFVPVSLGVLAVALLAMIAVKNGAGVDRVGLAGQGIGPDVVAGRDVIPQRVGACQGTRTYRQHQNREG